jgi:DNA polymerase-3 subunit alpha
MHNDFADYKNNRKKNEYFHPDAAELLGDTYGLMIYQESVMRVAQKFAGYSLAEADTLRKACGKKDKVAMAEQRAGFEAGCIKLGYGDGLGKTIFDIIAKFADYAFAKSHAYGYGLISYQTAYLKTHFPVEYLACLLTSVKTNYEKAAVYLSDARMSNIVVLTPDINLSGINFEPVLDGEVRKITFGLSAIRNVGEGLSTKIVEHRNTYGPFESFYDFAERVPTDVLNKRAIESLIKAGAFDKLGHPRKGLLASFMPIIDTTLKRREEKDQGVMSLFGEMEETEGGFSERQLIPDLHFEKSEQLKFEKEMLGLYVSDHPLMGIEGALRRRVDCTIPEALESADGAFMTIGGIVNQVNRRYTKRGDQMATFMLEDLQGAIEVTVFPKTLEKYGHQLADDMLISVRGRMDARDETKVGFMATEIIVLEGLRSSQDSLHLRFSAQAITETLISDLQAVLKEHPGDSPVFLHLSDDKAVSLGAEYTVNLDRVMGQLRASFGDAATIA